MRKTNDMEMRTGLMSRGITLPSYLVYALLSLCAGLLLIIIIILVVIMTTDNGVNQTELSIDSKLGNLTASLNAKVEHLLQHGLHQSDVQKILNAVGGLREEIRKKNGALDHRCNSDWIYYALSCYYVSEGTESWSDAKKDCENRKSHLVVINSAEEQIYVSKMTKKINTWIGLTEVSGSWRWVDGTSYDTAPKFWVDNEPNDHPHGLAGTEDCAHIRYGDRWNDERCSQSYQYICELETS
ncbi:asialoglycoprotein receptor 1-like [Mixophyes fleayi]|uniref:asialoglycoprotein receptor 1-like n=1 Tax=Mixophyes fleayi TaxID=3061075 RepID=UPI003F4E1C3C